MTPRTIKDFEALTGDEALTPAERRLIEACRAGEPCMLGDERPTAATAENRIRASLLKVLITGGTADCGLHENGVVLMCAWIEGQLDLSFTRARGRTVLEKCYFIETPRMQQAELSQLDLNGCYLPGLWAPGLKVAGQMVLRAVTAYSTVDLNGAEIGEWLACNDAYFHGNGSSALIAHGMKVREHVSLRSFTARGTVYLSGAAIGGQLACESARFDGNGHGALMADGMTVRADLVLWSVTAIGAVVMASAEIGGQLNCTAASFHAQDGHAIQARRLSVAELLVWRQVEIGSGIVDLNRAHVGDLVDDMASWPHAPEQLNLDGFTYDRITAAPTDAQARLPWLAKGSTFDGAFHPQPYTQLAMVLGQMGKTPDANDVLIERDRRLAEYYRGQRLGSRSGSIAAQHLARAANLGLFVWDWITRFTTGYGYKPLRTIRAGFLIYVAALVLAYFAWANGDMTPNSDVMLMSPEWRALAEDPAQHAPADVWAGTDRAGRDWETFSSFGYALDLVVPLLDLGQTDAWAPSPARGLAGQILWFMRWILAFAGWLVSGLAVAAVSASIKQARG